MEPISPHASWPAISLSEANRLLTAPGMPLEIEEMDIRGVRLKVWKHAPKNLREVFLQGRQHGEKIFLVYERTNVSILKALQKQAFTWPSI